MAEEKTTIKRRRKRKATKKRSVVDSAARNAAALSDGCNPEFVIGAEFDGVFEMNGGSANAPDRPVGGVSAIFDHSSTASMKYSREKKSG